MPIMDVIYTEFSLYIIYRKQLDLVLRLKTDYLLVGRGQLGFIYLNTTADFKLKEKLEIGKFICLFFLLLFLPKTKV